MRWIPELKQSTVNLVVIIGVIIIAAGAWTMPMYQAQLAHDDATQIINDVAQVQGDVNDVQGDLTQDGIQVGDSKQDILGLISSNLNDETKNKLFGDNADDFESQFLKFDKDFQAASNFKVETFQPANPRFKFPNDLTGFSVIERNTGGSDQPGTSNCNTHGTTFDADPVANGNQPLSANEPSSIDGFALQAPAVATQIVEIQICLDPGPVIIDELIQLTNLQVITKNFDFGVIPPGANLKVLIHDVPNAGATYKIWIFRNNPIVIPINFIGGVGGGAANFQPCTSITINVDTGADPDVLPDNGLAVPVNIHGLFIPIGANKITVNGVAQFTAADFGGQMPTGNYEFDVFPIDPTQFPQHGTVNCPNNGTPTATVTLANAAQFAVALGGGTGNLIVNIKNQFGVPLANTRAFVDASSFPLVNDVCEDGNAGARLPNDGTICVDIPAGDNLAIANSLVDPVANGTFTINGLPIGPGPTGGTYNVNVCGAPPIGCSGASANLMIGQTTTVEVSIFVPGI